MFKTAASLRVVTHIETWYSNHITPLHTSLTTNGALHPLHPTDHFPRPTRSVSCLLITSHALHGQSPVYWSLPPPYTVSLLSTDHFPRPTRSVSYLLITFHALHGQSPVYWSLSTPYTVSLLSTDHFPRPTRVSLLSIDHFPRPTVSLLSTDHFPRPTRSVYCLLITFHALHGQSPVYFPRTSPSVSCLLITFHFPACYLLGLLWI